MTDNKAADRQDNPVRTTPGEAARLRALGFNVIPIRAGSKMVRTRRTGDILKWCEEKCGETVRSDDSIAMLHGSTGGTWAMDCDEPTILKDLVREKDAKDMCVVKTPNRGHHVLFRRDADDHPPGDLRFRDAAGRRLDVKAVGYTLLPPSVLLPPSIRSDSELGRYEYQSTVDAPRITMKWSDALQILHVLGFSSPSDCPQQMAN